MRLLGLEFGLGGECKGCLVAFGKPRGESRFQPFFLVEFLEVDGPRSLDCAVDFEQEIWGQKI